MDISRNMTNEQLEETLAVELKTGKIIVTDIIPVSEGYTNVYLAQATPEDRIPSRGAGGKVSSVIAACLGWDDPTNNKMYILRGIVNVLDTVLEKINLEIGKPFALPSVQEEIVIFVEDTFALPYAEATVVKDGQQRVRTSGGKHFYSVTTLKTIGEFEAEGGHSTFKYDPVQVNEDAAVDLSAFGASRD